MASAILDTQLEFILKAAYVQLWLSSFQKLRKRPDFNLILGLLPSLIWLLLVNLRHTIDNFFSEDPVDKLRLKHRVKGMIQNSRKMGIMAPVRQHH